MLRRDGQRGMQVGGRLSREDISTLELPLLHVMKASVVLQHILGILDDVFVLISIETFENVKVHVVSMRTTGASPILPTSRELPSGSGGVVVVDIGCQVVVRVVLGISCAVLSHVVVVGVAAVRAAQ